MMVGNWQVESGSYTEPCGDSLTRLAGDVAGDEPSHAWQKIVRSRAECAVCRELEFAVGQIGLDAGRDVKAI